MTRWAYVKGPAQVWPFQFKGKQSFTGLLPSLQQNLYCKLQHWSGDAVQFAATWWPLSTKRSPLPSPPSTFPSTPPLPLASSLPTKWMTAFRNTRVRHDSEVHMLCHLHSTCFDASAAREAEKYHACTGKSSQLMLQPDTASKRQFLTNSLISSALQNWNNYLWCFRPVINCLEKKWK